MYLLLNVPRMPSVDLYNLYWAHLKDFLVCKEELILFRTRGGGKTICFGRKRDRQNHLQELYYWHERAAFKSVGVRAADWQ